jgi:hypothetical protein
MWNRSYFNIILAYFLFYKGGNDMENVEKDAF